jgi:hypothetical protein
MLEQLIVAADEEITSRLDLTSAEWDAYRAVTHNRHLPSHLLRHVSQTAVFDT